MVIRNQITYIGHATLLLEMDGVRLLTDPILRDSVFHLHRRSASVSSSSYQNIDSVLISHLHRDHFDIPSLRMLGRETQLIVPAGAADLLRKKGFSNIDEMRPGDSARIGALSVQATYAQHQSTYPPFGPSTEALGYLIRGTQSIYFPGDTDVFPGMADLADGLDVALLPVWGWGPNIGPGHMNPHRAAEALTLLRPRMAIPIHWGTFYPRGLGWFRANLMVMPPQLFKQAASKQMPMVEIHVLTPGSSVSLS
jgi:L-ascorbate metabolism protein UlaG (beta-lactamase superfamily)